MHLWNHIKPSSDKPPALNFRTYLLVWLTRADLLPGFLGLSTNHLHPSLAPPSPFPYSLETAVHSVCVSGVGRQSSASQRKSSPGNTQLDTWELCTGALLVLGFQPVYWVMLRAGNSEHDVLLLSEVCVYNRVLFGEFKSKGTFPGLRSKREHLGQEGKKVLFRGCDGWRLVFKSQRKCTVTKQFN